MTIEKLTPDKVDSYIELRIKQLLEEGASGDTDLRPALLDYCQRHMADGSFIGFIAVEDGRIIATGGLSIVEKPPWFSCPSGKFGILSSMYTLKEYRRQGIAREILKQIADTARTAGCGQLQITASDMGTLLYSDFGFVRSNNFMQYKL